MSLNLQLKTILASLLFGIYFSFFISIIYKFLEHKNKLIKFLKTFIFIILNVYIYFLIIKKINNGIFHYYEILCIIVGVLFHSFIVKHIIVKYKKK